MTTADNLKYLFEARFKDGSIFTQPLDDRHPNHDDSLEHNGSSFSYVMEREDELTSFALIGDGKRFSVDLKSGIFDVNNIPVRPYPKEYPIHTKELKLVYYREIKRETKVTGVVDDELKLQTSEDVVAHYISHYVIGWQVVGENYTQIMAIQ